jgi:hypothetical protein
MKLKCGHASRALGRLAFVLSAVAILPSFAQTQPNEVTPKYSANVQLVVACDDESLKNQFTSFLSRELRSLGDIVLVGENPDYIMEVTVMKAITVGGTATGFVVETNISKPFDTRMLSDCSRFPGSCLKGKVDDNRLMIIQVLTENTRRIIDATLRMGPLDKIQSTCQEIIADFDTKTLALDRRLWEIGHKQSGNK